MKRKLRQFFRQLHSEHMSEAERTQIQSALESCMHLNPAAADTHAGFASPNQGMFLFLVRKPLFVSIVLVILVVAGGSASFAAEYAVPGDPLYGIKVNINERVYSAVAISGENKGTWEVSLVERRLHEAEKLSEENKLSAIVSNDLSSAVQAHSRNASRIAIKLATEKNDEASAKVSSSLEASLKAHAEVLLDLSVTSNNEVKKNIAKIITDTVAESDAAVQSRTDAKAKATIKGGPRTEGAARGALIASGRAILEATNFVAKHKNEVSTSTVARAEVKIKEATETRAQAETKIKSESYAESFVLAHTASRLAHEAKVLLQSSRKLHLKIENTGNATASTTITTDQNNARIKARLKVLIKENNKDRADTNRGQDGEDGEDGENGRDGEDGIDGNQGSSGQNGRSGNSSTSVNVHTNVQVNIGF